MRDDHDPTASSTETPGTPVPADERAPFVHPYIPNSEPSVKRRMLERIGARSVEEFYADIPAHLRMTRPLDLPAPMVSECELRRHVSGMLSRNASCDDHLSFLGGGCWQHYVPAICDEINGRGEFLTAYAGEPYDDHGRFQALFEYASMMGELLEMDVVNVPTYDWAQAAATAVRMAVRITGRGTVLVVGTVGPDRLAKMRDYCAPSVKVETVERDPRNGCADVAALERRMGAECAAVYFETPGYLGAIEPEGGRIAELAREHGALCVVGADPISLGVLSPPAAYGADIACGDLQPLGMHMQYGGGHAGFIATHDDEKFVMEYPSRLFGIIPTSVEGEWGFGDVAYDRTSFGRREEGKEFVGTASALWGITAGVYLALMGPKGMQDVGRTIVHNSHYAMKRLSSIPGVEAPALKGAHFKEFVVRFSGTGRTVAHVNERLLAEGIFGGHDLSGAFPELGQSALYCVTEVHTRADIDRLVDVVGKVVRDGA